MATRLHVVVNTHTERHLAGVLAGLIRQTHPPDTLTVASDVDDPGIGDLVKHWRPRLSIRQVRWVRRPHTGEARPAQTRNNAVRALVSDHELDENDLLLFVDGDMVLSDDAGKQHMELATQGFDIILANRVNLTEDETARFDPEAYGKGNATLSLSDEETARLARDQKRNMRDLRRQFLPWTKAHRPALIGGHHAVCVHVYKSVNGFDEEFEGWGREDDDVARRIYCLRPRIKVAVQVDRILAFHLWHPTRWRENFRESSAYVRFKRIGVGPVAEHGLESPLAQPVPESSVIV